MSANLNVSKINLNNIIVLFNKITVHIKDSKVVVHFK